MRGLTQQLSALALTAGLLAPAAAQADLLTFWVAGRGDYVTGTGDTYANFDSSLGFGGELGLEVLGIDLWGEALAMGTDQGLFTVNAGFDVSMGDDVRFTGGLFTGPVFFLYPKQTVSRLALSGTTIGQALEANNVNVAQVESEYNKLAEEEEDLSRLAFGWNVARLRVNLEKRLAPFVFLGANALAGYHYILTGEDVAAGAKNKAVDDVAEKYSLDNELTKMLRDEVGAKDVDPDKLAGMNLDVGLYIRFEL